MKKFIIAMVAMFTMTFTTASAMSYEQARQQALFLTDKMAYELNLTDDQYEAAYEVNLDYLMGVNTYDDLYGAYWRQRNLDLSYILLDWQYRTFCAASYFYRPLYWDAGYFHFGIYARYPRRDYFFFGRPHFYGAYNGGHSWRMNGGRSWYQGRQFGGPRPGGATPRVGMRDGFNRGDFGRGMTFGNMNRQSSTRTTVTRNGQPGGNNIRQGAGGTFGNGNNRGGAFGNGTENRSNRSVGNGGSFGNNRSYSSPFGNSRSNSSSSFGNSRSNSSSSFGGNRGGSFGSESRSFSGGNARSFGGGSFGGGSSTRGGGGSFGGGNNGGSHFGGRR